MGIEKSRRTFDEKQQKRKALETKEMSTRRAVDEEWHHLLSSDAQVTTSEFDNAADIHAQTDRPTLPGEETINF